MNARPDTLILGWGNPGRRDDGLGPAAIEALERLDLSRVTLDSNYQLQVEDAASLSKHDRVVFIDADLNCAEPFRFERLEPAVRAFGYTTHHVPPDRLLAMSWDLFRRLPQAWVLGIRGFEFDDFGDGLSERARSNLARAVEFLAELIREDRWHEYLPSAARSRSPMPERINHV